MSDSNVKKIIAVDDDFAVRMAMDFIFKKIPEYDLTLAEDPNDALRKLEQNEYMMMFCDINMPIMTGLDLLKIVKEKYHDMPVIMLTSETDIQNSISADDFQAINVENSILKNEIKILKKNNSDTIEKLNQIRKLLEEKEKEIQKLIYLKDQQHHG